MSQRGRPAFQTSRLSLSPQSQTAIHERIPAIRDDAQSQTFSDPGQIPGSASEGRSRPPSSRSLGISGLINSSEVPSTDRRLPASKTSPQIANYSQQGTPVSTPLPFVFSGQGHAAQEPGTPASQAVITPSGNTPTERQSPAGAFPFPTMNRPRRLLSPQPSGLGGAGAGGLHQPQPGEQHMPLQHAEPVSRRHFRDGNRDGASSNAGSLPALPFTGPHSSLSRPQTASLTPPRALSQPNLGQMAQPGSQNRHPFSTLPQELHDRNQEQHVQTSQPFASQGRAYATSIPPGSPIWPGPGQGTPLYNSIRSSAAAGTSDGQAMLRMSLGGDGESVDVVLDNRQASRQADEKRQRNAGASARFRKRKKDQIGALESENVDLKGQMQVLLQERDWFRAERDRLRTLLLQTSLSEHAAGPSSPVISAESVYASEQSPPGQVGSSAQALQGYGSGDSSGERPARRRRTSATPTFTTPTYGTPHPTPTSLPPINGPLYGGMANSPSMRHGDRLPPLRAVEGHLGPTGANVQRTSPPGMAHPGHARVPYETGWASHSSGPPGPSGAQGFPPPGSSRPPTGR